VIADVVEQAGVRGISICKRHGHALDQPLVGVDDVVDRLVGRCRARAPEIVLPHSTAPVVGRLQPHPPHTQPRTTKGPLRCQFCATPTELKATLGVRLGTQPLGFLPKHLETGSLLAQGLSSETITPLFILLLTPALIGVLALLRRSKEPDVAAKLAWISTEENSAKNGAAGRGVERTREVG
jgi:hypothetical protein